MTPDLAWWGTLVGRLAVQAAALVALGVAAEFRVRAPQARRALWQGVLVAVALVWTAEIAGLPGKLRLSGSRNEARPRFNSSGNRADSAPVAAQATATSAVSEDFPSLVVPPENSVEEEISNESLFPAPARPTPPPIPVKWPGWVWFCGSTALLLRSAVAFGFLAVQRRRMTAVGPETESMVAQLRRPLGLRRVALQVWPGLRGPIAFGLWRPAVALPVDFDSRFTPSQRHAMLAHELAHLAARDPFWLALADAVLALAWWHPAVWWARRRLRVAGEAAADEASALVPSGPSALAESLVLFGRELVGPKWTRGLGVAGSGLRSDLSRRVSALLTHSGVWNRLPDHWRWSPRLAALGIAAMMAAVPVRAGFSGSVLAALTLPAPARETRDNALVGNNTDTNALTPTKTVDGASRFPSASSKLGDPGAPVTPTEPDHRSASATIRTNLTYTREGRRKITQKLNGIRLDVVQFDNVPLGGVLKQLFEASMKGDPERVGINFMINSRADLTPASTDPSVPPSAPLDLGNVLIKINSPLHDVSLRTVLDAVCQVADAPITYDIEDYAVVFVPRPQTVETLISRTFRVDPNTFVQGLKGLSAMSSALRTQTNSALEVVKSGTTLGLHEMVREYFTAAGANLDPPKNVFFNERSGILMVHATQDNINVIRRAIELLNYPSTNQTPPAVGSFPGVILDTPDAAPLPASTSRLPAAKASASPVTLLVRFTLLPEQSPGELGLDWLFGQSATNNPPPRSASAAEVLQTTNLTHTENFRIDAFLTEGQSATLTAAQFKVLLDTIEEREGTDVLSAPTIKTLSGRRARIEIGDAHTIVSAVEAKNGSPATKTQASIGYITENVTTGPMLDVTPVVEGGSWRLTALAGFTEFLGYDHPGKADEIKVSYGDAKPLYGQKPLPHFRALEARASALVASGETLALRGPSFGVTNKVKGGMFRREKTKISRERIYIFVTVMPETPTGKAANEHSSETVTVGKTPPYLSVRSGSITLEEFTRRLKIEVASDPDFALKIQSVRDAPLGEVLKVTKAAKEANVKITPSLLVLPDKN